MEAAAAAPQVSPKPTATTPLLPPPIARPAHARSMGNKLWMVVSIVAALSATGVLLLSLRHGERRANSMSLWSSTAMDFSKKRGSSEKSTSYYGVKYTSMTYSQKSELFTQFKTDFKKEYASSEETMRLAYFLAFLETVDARNEKEAAAGGTAVHGITMFSDLSPDEFKAYRGANVAMKGGVPGSEIALEAVVEEVDSKVRTSCAAALIAFSTSLSPDASSSRPPPPSPSLVSGQEHGQDRGLDRQVHHLWRAQPRLLRLLLGTCVCV
jgi:hypothetical protein